MRRILIVGSVLLIMSASINAADNFDLLQEGNKYFVAGEFQHALESYVSAESIMPENPRLDYNIAGALYKNAKYEEAVDKYTKALGTPDTDVQQASHYNLGNTYYRMGDYQKAITSFENALNLNPDDLDAKLNLELARKMLKEQMKPQDQQKDQEQKEQKQQEQDKKKDKQEGEDKQKKDKQDKGDQQQDQQDQKNKQDKKDQQQKMQDKKEMSKEDAERILNALRDDEKDIQKKIKRQAGRGNYSGKDW